MKKYLLFFLFLFCSTISFSQEQHLKGVLENNGETLIGANVVVYRNGASIGGTITDIDGKYSIACIAGDEIRCSYVGYATQSFIVTHEMLTPLQQPINKKKAHTKVNKTIQERNRNREVEWKTSFESFRNMDSVELQIEKSYRSGERIDFTVKNGKVKFKFKEQPTMYEVDIVQKMGLAYVQNRNLHQLQNTYALGRPVNGELTTAPLSSNEVFSWGPRYSGQTYDNSLYASSFYMNTAVKLDMLKNNKRKFAILHQSNSSDIVNRYSQNSFSGKVGLAKYNGQRSKDYTLSEFSFVLQENENHNHLGYYHEVQRSMMLQNPSFDSNQKEDGEFTSFSSKYNNPRWILDQNQSRISNYDFGLSLLRRKRVHLLFDEYKDGISLSTNIASVSDIYQEGTAGMTDGFFRDISIVRPRIQFTQSGEISSDYLDDLKLRVSNVLTGEYLLYEDTAPDAGLDVYRKGIVRYQPNVGLDYDGYRIHAKLNWTPLLASNQDVQLLAPRFSLKSNKYVKKKYLDEITFFFNYAREAKLHDFFLQKNNYTSLLNNHYDVINQGYNVPLFVNGDLENEIKDATQIGVGFTNKYRRTTLYTSLLYKYIHQSNMIFPVYDTEQVVLDNVGSFATHAIEWRSSVNKRFYNDNILEFLFGHRINYNGQLGITAFRTKVNELQDGRTSLPIAGFQNISKNLIVGQPAGVIVGSDFVRDAEGNVLITEDGFPILSQEKHIIADPTPDFLFSIKNELKSEKFEFAFELSGQVGGDVWNGTQQTLDYHGMSENTADERERTDYVFEGVTADGIPNTKEVALANPEAGLEGNRWTRYGQDGVAADYIESGTHIRLENISIGYTKNISHQKHIKFKLYATNLLTLATFQGYSNQDIFDDNLTAGLQYFNQPNTTQIGTSIHIKF